MGWKGYGIPLEELDKIAEGMRGGGLGPAAPPSEPPPPHPPTPRTQLWVDASTVSKMLGITSQDKTKNVK